MIAIVCAMDAEAKGLLSVMKNRRTQFVGPYNFDVGEIAGKYVVVCKCGVGKISAAAATAVLINSFQPEVLINSGVAGGALPLQQGDVVIATKSVQHDYHVPDEKIEYYDADARVVDLLATCAKLTNCKCYKGKIATGDRFIEKAEESSYIGAVYGAQTFDMETAAIMKVCSLFGVKCGAIRAISDNGVDDGMKSFYEFLTEACAKSVNIMLKFVELY